MNSLRQWVELVTLALLLISTAALRAEAPDDKISPGDSADPAALAKIAPRMQQFVDDKQIAGAVTLIALRGKIVHLDAVGWADIAAKRPMTRDNLFAIASMTKPITATAILILQDEGKLSVNDPVSKFIPQFKDARLADRPLAREITIRDLMTHTAGLSPPTGKGSFGERSLRETAELIAAAPLQFEPGSKWKYSDGITVCGAIIEAVSGKKYDEFLTERIFRPLGMNVTTFYPDLRRVATMYHRTASGDLEAVMRRVPPAGGGDLPTPNPSGGLYSTASDIARFYQMILDGGQFDGKQIVSRAAVEQMTHVQTGDLVTGFTPGNGWGLGWCIVRQPQGITKMLSPGTFGHGGAYGTQGWVDSKRQMIFVLMVQRSDFPNSDASDVRRAFQQLAAAAMRGG
jgi:CubicO group peptidase (beta-lactamase class C family)